MGIIIIAFKDYYTIQPQTVTVFIIYYIILKLLHSQLSHQSLRLVYTASYHEDVVISAAFCNALLRHTRTNTDWD